MQADMHYCCIRVLAQAAGLKPTNAQTVAYASQYTDDATEHEGIHIDGVPDFAGHLVEDGLFEPVCTAHRGIQFIHGLEKDVQTKVYIPFHFVPPSRFSGEGRYDFRVRSDSQFARGLVEDAIQAARDARGDNEAYVGTLVRLGVALHSYADTWSHQGFSGRWSSADNDIERIHILQDGSWEPLPWFEQLKHNIIPDVGHAEAVNFPDKSHLSWRYEHDASGREVTRHNTEIFLEAAEAIYRLLCELGGARPVWKMHVDSLRGCIGLAEDSVKAKFKAWRNAFPDVQFDYDSERWRSEALRGDRVDWDHFKTKEDFATLSFRARGGLSWFHFHVAAKQQRQHVVNSIRGDLL